jgi:phosphoglycolate phosphatase-like HAD superfamily hydrolase
MTIRAVLFDVGGPLSTEIEHERAIDADIRSLFAEAGMPVSDARYADVWRSAVGSFAPNAYEAVIWRLAGGDEEIAPSVYREVARRSHERGSFQLRDGIPELLAELTARGLRLGLAANQPAKSLGMRAVRLRSGRHAGQGPRTQHERPDAEATDVPGLRAAILELVG